MLNPEDVFLRYVVECEREGEHGALARVAQAFQVERSSITRMAKRYRFAQRYAGDVVPKIQERTNEVAAVQVGEWRAEQSRVGSGLVRKGMRALENMEPQSVKEALDAIKLGAAMVDKATEPNQKRVAVDVTHVLKERFERFVETAPAPAPRLKVDFGELDDDE